MEKKIQLPKEAQPWTEVEVLFIDGCKVMCGTADRKTRLLSR